MPDDKFIIHLRPYRDSDLPAMKDITAEAFSGVSIDANIEFRLGPAGEVTWQSRKLRHLDDDVAAPNGQIIVAESDRGDVVGYITTRHDPVSKVGLIPNLAVKAGLRGQGLGRRLIEAALAALKAGGMEIARIETLDQNEIGKHLYPECGFVEVARQIHFAKRL